jgi:hypothetical protein
MSRPSEASPKGLEPLHGKIRLYNVSSAEAGKLCTYKKVLDIYMLN